MYDVQDIIQGNVRTMTMADVVRKSYIQCVSFTYVLGYKQRSNIMAKKEVNIFSYEII